MEPKLMPRDLKLVAILFIIFGILSAIDVLLSLLNSLLHLNFKHYFSYGFYLGTPYLNLGVLQIPIGFGLLSLKQRWHRWAIIYLKVAIALVIFFLLFFCIGFILGASTLKISLQKVGVAPHEMAIWSVAGAIILLTLLTLWMTLTLWMYRVLNKSSTLELFNADNGIVALNLRNG